MPLPDSFTAPYDPLTPTTPPMINSIDTSNAFYPQSTVSFSPAQYREFFHTVTLEPTQRIQIGDCAFLHLTFPTNQIQIDQIHQIGDLFSQVSMLTKKVEDLTEQCAMLKREIHSKVYQESF